MEESVSLSLTSSVRRDKMDTTDGEREGKMRAGVGGSGRVLKWVVTLGSEE